MAEQTKKIKRKRRRVQVKKVDRRSYWPDLASEKLRKAAHEAEAAASDKEEVISSHAINKIAQSLHVSDVKSGEEISKVVREHNDVLQQLAPLTSFSMDQFNFLRNMVMGNRARLLALETKTLWQKVCAVLNHKLW